MFELGNNDRFLEVRVKGERKPRMMPLAGSLPVKDGMRLARIERLPEDEQADAMMDAIYDLFCGCLGQDVVDSMSMADFEALAQVWQDASEEDGISAGESQASPES